MVLFWIAQGIRIFRVDNPHTKPFAFWEWLIGEVQERLSRGDFSGGGVYATQGDVPAGQTGVHAVVHVLRVEKYQGGNDRIFHGNHAAAGERFFLAQSVAQYARYPGTNICRRAGGRRLWRAWCWRARWERITEFTVRRLSWRENKPVREGSEEYLDSEKYQVRVGTEMIRRA